MFYYSTYYRDREPQAQIDELLQTGYFWLQPGSALSWQSRLADGHGLGPAGVYPQRNRKQSGWWAIKPCKSSRVPWRQHWRPWRWGEEVGGQLGLSLLIHFPAGRALLSGSHSNLHPCGIQDPHSAPLTRKDSGYCPLRGRLWNLARLAGNYHLPSLQSWWPLKRRRLAGRRCKVPAAWPCPCPVMHYSLNHHLTECDTSTPPKVLHTHHPESTSPQHSPLHAVHSAHVFFHFAFTCAQ